MKKGMPTLLEFNNIEENINFAKNNNLDFIELNMNLPYCLNIKEKELLKYNFEFTMHTSEDLNIYELNEHLRKSYIKEIKRQIKLGISNNIKRYTIHLNQGTYFTLPDKRIYLNEKYLQDFNKSLNKSLIELNELAKENNILINFENTRITDSIKIAIDEISKYDNLGFTLDIGHNEGDNNKFFDYLKMKDKIRHIHIHDYNGKSDHMPIGKGIINFDKYKELFNNNYLVIEVKVSKDLLESIKNI